MRVASFQYGFDDTTFVIAEGDTVLVDVNDCKIRGRALQRVLETFGRPTFVFKSYSFAQSYPIAYTAEDPTDLQLLTRESYFDDFAGRVHELRPDATRCRSAAWSPSSTPRTATSTGFLITPDEVVAAYRRRTRAGDAAGARHRVVPMAPGDSWDAETGFTRSTVDWYTDRESPPRRACAESVAAPARRAGRGARTGADALLGRSSTTTSVASCEPLPPLTGRFVMQAAARVRGAVVTGAVLGRRRPAPARRAHRDAAGRTGRASCACPRPSSPTPSTSRSRRSSTVGCASASSCEPAGISDDLAFWGLMNVWELGYLRPRTWLRPRFWKVLWRRREEYRAAFKAFRGGGGSFFDRMAKTIAEPEESGTPGAADAA